MSLLAELSRRNVFRAAAAYVAVAWLLIQVAETVLPAFGFGDLALRRIIVGLAIGLVPAVAMAWAFELTPQGLRRERDLDRGSELARRTNRLLDRGIVLLLALGVTYFAIDKFVLGPAREQARIEQALERGRSEALAEVPGEASIVVLPFANMSSDPEQSYFADGMAEELLNLLARIPELRVISRTSAFAFKGKDVGIAEIAAQLKASHVLEGSVRRSGDRLRVTAQLIDARTDAHLWSETYERPLDDIFAIQDEIAGHVVDALRLELLGERPTARRVDTQAYVLFMQARQMLDSDQENYARIDALLQRAIEIEPRFADPWTAVAWLHYRCFRGMAAPDDEFCRTMTVEQARAGNDAALDRALAIDPDNAIATAYVAYRQLAQRRDFQGAAALLERAVRLGPTQTDVLRPAMILANFLRRPELAIRIGEYALERDPLCSLCAYQLAQAYASAGRLADAEATLRSFVAAGRGGEYSLGQVLLLSGRPQEAMQQFAQLGEGGDALRLAGQAMALHSLGQPAESRAALAALEKGHAGTHAFRLAEAHAWIGNLEQAARWLNMAVESVDERDLTNAYVMLRSPFLGETLQRPEMQPTLLRLGATAEQLAAVTFEPRLPGTARRD